MTDADTERGRKPSLFSMQNTGEFGANKAVCVSDEVEYIQTGGDGFLT